jgi:hypothetical protein
MPTNLALDDELIAEAQRLGGFRTKREAVNAALAEYVAERKRRALVDIFGTVDYDPGYDYRKLRDRDRPK